MASQAATLLQVAWQFVLWLIRRAFIMVYTALLIVAIIWLPTLWEITFGFEHSSWKVSFSVARYWKNLTTYLRLLLTGGLKQLPMHNFGYNAATEDVKGLLSRTLPSTLILFTVTLVLALVVGGAAGHLLSRFGSRRPWLQRLGMSTNLLALSLPDMVVAIGLIELVFQVGRALKLHPHVFYDPLIGWRNYIIPVLALAIVPTAYVARVAAVALDQVREELYMRSALAKGLPPGGVARHAWRNAFIQVWSTLPALVGMLISSQVIVEWIVNLPGVGRELGYILRPPENARAVLVGGLGLDVTGINFTKLATICLILVLFYLVVDTLQDGVHRLLDPRLRRQPAGTAWYAAAWHWLRGLPRSTAAFLAAVPRALLAIAMAPVTAARAWSDARAARAALAAGGEEVSWWRQLGAAYRGNGPLILGSIILGVLVLLSIVAPWFAPHSPYHAVTVLQYKGHFVPPPLPAMPGWPLGSDELGRDALARLLYGARYTLILALMILVLRYLVALPWGLLAGWRAGAWEWTVRRAQVLFGALPGVAVPAIFLLRIGTIPGIKNWPEVILSALVVALPGAPRLAESLRLQTREIAHQPYVEGARAVGASGGRVLRRHVLPNLLQRLLVMGVLELSWITLLLAQLGLFNYYVGGLIIQEVGFGASTAFWPLLPDWGSQIDAPVRWLAKGSIIPLLPVVGIFLAVAGFNLLGEGLRRHFRGQDQVGLGG